VSFTLLVIYSYPLQFDKVPDTVNTVMCASDDGWRYHLKHVEQFSRNK